jgi:AcrR family transcriptional regulator
VSTAARRGPYAKSASRIERILDVAVELFADNGFRATTMKEIAERAGMSQTGLMHHFRTKTDVLIAVLRRRDEQSEALIAEAVALPPLERLLAIADEMRNQPRLMALHCVLCAEATAPDHPAHAYFAERTAVLVTRIGAAFTELQRQGVLRADVAPASLARTMLALLDGLELQWLYDPDSVDIKAELRTFLSVWTT